MTVAYPLAWPEGWPRVPEHRRRSGNQFKTTFERARRDLTLTLEKLNAKSPVISSWLELRLDGKPRADSARRSLPDPGVAVYFMRQGRQIVMARDAYTTVHDNLRSIGIALEHLRGLERHGGAHMMEKAFAGFAALPPPDKPSRPWWEVLDVSRDAPLWMIDAAYKHFARTKHPDLGGTAEAMKELNEARAEALKERT